MPDAALKTEENTGFGLIRVIKSRMFRIGCIALFTYTAVYAVVLMSIVPERYDIYAGDVSGQSIKATKDIVDELTTGQLREEAKSQVLDTYKLDTGVTQSVIEQYNMYFSFLYEVRQEIIRMEKEYEANLAAQEPSEEINSQTNNGSVEEVVEEQDPDAQDPKSQIYDQIVDKYLDMSPVKISLQDFVTAISGDSEEIGKLDEKGSHILTSVLSTGVKSDSLLNVKSSIMEELQAINTSNEIRTLGYNLLSSVIQPNLIFDQAATEIEKENAAKRVEPIIYKKGQNVVKEGEIVTEAQLKVLEDLGLLKDNKIDLPMYVGIGVLILILHLLVILYISIFERAITNKVRNIVIISCMSVLFLVIALFIEKINVYLIPLAAAAMLFAILLTPRLAVVLNMVLSITVGFIVGFNINFMLISIIGGTIVIFCIINPQQRNTLVWAGMTVGAVNFSILVSMGLIYNSDIKSVLIGSLWGIGNGVLCSVIAIGTLPIWENAFDILTPIKLLELSNPNNTVLKKLLVEAPGTYHHSIIVSNLAERAVEVLKGNTLLARVGAYYHDIGKIVRPYFFKENQVSGENPHDKISPNLSTLILTSHTRDGVELAKKNKLPLMLQDIISQHHGTTIVAYFYHKAKNGQNDPEIREDDFRYEGKKPQTKEAAVIMLADAVEAAVRSLSNPSRGEIEGLVRKIVKDRLDDGQLNECELTLRDLNNICEAFCGLLAGIFHERVKYPDIQENTIKENRGR